MLIEQVSPAFIIDLGNPNRWIEVSLFARGIDVSVYEKDNGINNKLVTFTYYDDEIKSEVSCYIRSIYNYEIIGKTAKNIVLDLFYNCFVGNIADEWERKNDVKKDWFKTYFEK